MLCLLFTLFVSGTLHEHELVISFDDGPNNTTTPILLDTLLENNIRASFFVVGVNVNNCPLLRRMQNEGHIIGSHTFGHVHLRQLSHFRMVQEILMTERRIEQCTGQRPWFFRAPYGEINIDTRSFLRDRGYIIVGWDLDTFDWRKKTASAVVRAAKQLVSGRRRGAIMLMHEFPWTTNAQRRLLPMLRNMKWKIVHPLYMLSDASMRDLKLQACASDAPTWCTYGSRGVEALESTLENRRSIGDSREVEALESTLENRRSIGDSREVEALESTLENRRSIGDSRGVEALESTLENRRSIGDSRGVEALESTLENRRSIGDSREVEVFVFVAVVLVILVCYRKRKSITLKHV